MNIPKTPKPKSIDDIQEQARDRFAGVIICDKNNDILIDNYFMEYDHYESYDENKSYSKRVYQSAYKGVLREYQNYLYILELENENENREYYVVAKKLYNDLESLEKYCPCLKCSASYFNPLKYIWCPYCTNCIKTGKGFTKDEYIEQAQDKKNKISYQSPHKFHKYIQSNNILKVSEIIILIMFISVFYLLR
jgi:hypothetical protein